MLKNKITKLAVKLITSFSLVFAAADRAWAQETNPQSAPEKAIDIFIKEPANKKTVDSVKTQNTSQIKGLENILLWEVISPDNNNKSYFAGTFHIPFREGFVIPATFLDYMKECAQFVDEIDMSDLSGVNDLLAKYAFDFKRDLEKKLSKDKWKLLVTKLKKSSFPEKLVRNLKPWYLILVLQMQEVNNKPETTAVKPSQPTESGKNAKTTVPAKQTLSSYTDKVMDNILQKNARLNHLEMVHLETVEEQFQILSDALDESEYLKMLNDMLTVTVDNKSAKAANPLKDFSLISAYNANDLEEFSNISKAAEKYSLKYYDALINIRNEKWIVKLDEMLAGKNIFVAVGALHMVGEKGLIKALENKGYKINFIPLNRMNTTTDAQGNN